VLQHERTVVARQRRRRRRWRRRRRRGGGGGGVAQTVRRWRGGGRCVPTVWEKGQGKRWEIGRGGERRKMKEWRRNTEGGHRGQVVTENPGAEGGAVGCAIIHR
jgi:hypothetical protein